MAWDPLVEPNLGWKDQVRLPGRGSSRPMNINCPAEAGADLPGRRISSFIGSGRVSDICHALGLPGKGGEEL